MSDSENTPLYFRYWGKASPSDATDDGSRYHLLPYHCLDVAAVAQQLLDPEKALCQRLAEQLQVKPSWLQNWFTFCLALHDLGKYSSAFQGLASGLSEALVAAGNEAYDERHDSLGYLIWKEQLSDSLWDDAWQYGFVWNEKGLAKLALDPWLRIVTGHHGEPPLESLRDSARWFSGDDQRAAYEFVVDLTALLSPDFLPLKDSTLRKRLAHVSWQLAGIAVLADWSGSDQSTFSYQSEPMLLAQYWDRYALPAAEKAILKMQPEPVAVRPFSGIDKLFSFIQQPTPLQQLAAQVEMPHSPQLWILEDVTGAGKTEAALTLCSRMMSQGLADGVYIGLPTMATANGMYRRMSDSYRLLFTEDSQPSLILAHGARQLSKQFVDSVFLSEQLRDQNYSAGELSATAYCNSWLADNRKKALFSDVGVGTLDQALLAVLPARHQSLRLLGLQSKVLLVDEVHAYDPYMQSLLCALLHAHALQGGSAILLSATLPKMMRETLLRAYSRGRGDTAPPLGKDDYPLVTLCCGDNSIEYPVASRGSVCRDLAVRQLTEFQQIREQIQTALLRGQSVCWIRNTVGDAREAWRIAHTEAWTEADKISLFHSRFAMCDRQSIENDVLARFGKDSTAAQRHGQLLVATQVVEQSLDLDFDVMITDLAPVDLLIQRAGRLHRHSRDAKGNRLAVLDSVDQRPDPVLWIYAPQAAEQVTDKWLEPHWLGSQWVYQHVGQLWLTLDCIAARGWRLRMPEDARALIEAVYSDDAQLKIPPALEALSWDAEGDRLGESRLGQGNCLRLEKGYRRDSADSNRWDQDTRVPTRLTDDTVTVALARVVNGALQPWAEGEWHGWALSQLSLPAKQWRQAEQKIPASLRPHIEQLKACRSELRWIEILPLTEELAACYTAAGGWNLSKEER